MDTDRNSLSDDDLKRITARGDVPRCPDCQNPLREGPSGWSSINYFCDHCRTRFNLGVGFGGGFWTGELTEGVRPARQVMVVGRNSRRALLVALLMIVLGVVVALVWMALR